jgi:D-alanine--poly(phosphoribitol) ligase subunit 2
MDHNGRLEERTLEILRDVTGDDEVGRDLDLPLLASGLLDSLAIVTLMAAFEEAFGLVISPADFDKEAWSTARSLVADLEHRLTSARSA